MTVKIDVQNSRTITFYLRFSCQTLVVVMGNGIRFGCHG